MSDDLRSEFPNSPSMWTEPSAPAPSHPAAPASDEIARLQAEFPATPSMWPKPAPQVSDAEIAALQREYPASWRSMLPRGVQVPADATAAPPAEAKPAEKPADDTKPADSAKEPADPTKTAPPENAEVRAWAEKNAVHADAIPVFERAVAERTAEIASWRKAVLSDPELGSRETLTRVRALVREHGDADLIEILDSTGLGNHPSIVRLLARVARELDGR